MRTVTAGLLLGIIFALYLPLQPPILVGWLSVGFLALILILPKGRLLWAFLGGAGWALVQVNLMASSVLPAELEGEDLNLTLRIVSVPDQYPNKLRFLAEPLALQTISSNSTSPQNTDTMAPVLPQKIRLSWYRNFPQLRPGDIWNLTVRLKRPHGFANRGGFDYEKWLFTQRIGATGYVRSSETNQRLVEGRLSTNLLRYRLLHQIEDFFQQDGASGLLPALLLGIRSSISVADWDTLIQTGTNHLVAISGLHIGLVAGLSYWLWSAVWRWFPRLCLWLPARKAGVIAALIPAAGYAALAGFSVPTQRALVMLTVVAIGVLANRPFRPLSILAAALMIVLLLDSFAVLSPGFWLSFAAVAAILLMIRREEAAWRQGIRIQMLLSFALLPLTLWLFGQGSLIAPLANLIAVPVVAVIAVPLGLIGIVLVGFQIHIGWWLLTMTETALSLLLTLLRWLAELPYAYWQYTLPSFWVLAAALVAIGLLMMPKRFPGKWLAAIWLLPMFVVRPGQPEQGSFHATFLDVGQGLSVVVQTASHTLLFDTGARFSARFNSVESVVLPFLRAQGIEKIDTLILSHSDNDHAGGQALLRRKIPVNQVLASFEPSQPQAHWNECTAGHSWVWDGVEFSILHPSAGWQGEENERSCVLAVGDDSNRLLLTGDIGRKAERWLLKLDSAKLAARVLQVPHHGSRTSSTAGFIEAVNPDYAVFPVGYRNRFGFPKPDIVDRYHRHGVLTLRTDHAGAISYQTGRGPEAATISRYRELHRRIWQSVEK